MWPARFRWTLLLAASYFFYMCWKPAYLVLILISTLVDYCVALPMARTDSQFRRKAFLFLSLSANLGMLFSFKYFNFFNESLRQILHHFPISYDVPQLNVLLPVGISFYTFQTLSYTIEVYRGTQEPERHFGLFALYVSYFPQLVAGPIERPQNLLPQFHQRYNFDYDRVTDGLGLIVWGLFKKVVIADRLGLLVDNVYSQPDQFNGASLLIATVFFAYQIYCDFSGYSDIAIGCAQVMGHTLMTNFNRPYFAASIPDFWRRWHISLSSWFRDYLYIPLGGNRVPLHRLYLNLLIVFVVSGLWHGANWTFMAWGLLHGLYYVASKITHRFREKAVKSTGMTRLPRLHHLLKIIITFTLVCFAWIFFRADSMSDAVVVVSRLGTGWGDTLSTSGFEELVHSFNMHEKELWRSIVLCCVLMIVQHLSGSQRVTALFARLNKPMRWSVYIGLVLAILNLGVTKEIPFIYFQF